MATLQTYQDILRRDADAPPASMIDNPGISIGPKEIPINVYTSREYHEREKQKIWSQVWQMACREEQIPNPGDQYIYDICDKSFLVVRTRSGEVRAFYNSCPHKGRRLRNLNGSAPSIRCSYHGFTWDLTGENAYIPCADEFSSFSKEDWRLPPVAVGLWGGFVFVNPAANPEPFEKYIGAMPEHFKKWPLEERYIAKHVIKKLRCNWKIAQEAFMEALHVSVTHPQGAWSSGDGRLSQLDVFGDNVARTIMPRGVPSPYLHQAVSEQEITERMLLRFSRKPDKSMADGATARSEFAALMRQELGQIIGAARAAELSITECCDAIHYTLFPNCHPWGAYYRNYYLFKPLGDDHENCTFELMVLAPFKGDRPPPSQPEALDLDDSWTSANIGPSGPILDQDTNNIQQVQSGLHASAFKTVRLAEYQEGKIRWFYARYQDFLDENWASDAERDRHSSERRTPRLHSA